MDWGVSLGAVFCWEFEANRQWKRRTWRGPQVAIREPFQHPGGAELSWKDFLLPPVGCAITGDGLGGGQSAGEGLRLYADHNKTSLVLRHF